jgi:hypothetical protein
MVDDLRESTIGVLISQVEFMREDIRELSKDLKKANDDKVSHREWSQRNTEVNGRFHTQGREIGDLRTELRAKSAPWWSVGSVIVAVAALAYTVLGP